MKIVRDGKMYELTRSEVEQAYFEMEQEYLEADAIRMLQYVFEDEGFEHWKYTYAMQPEAKIARLIVRVYHENEDSNVAFNDTMEGAVNQVIDELQMTPHVLECLWAALGDVCVDDDGNIDEEYMDFSVGTNREDIWHWFDERYPGGVAVLMNLA